MGRTVSLPAGAVKTEAHFLLRAVSPCGSGRISPTADDTGHKLTVPCHSSAFHRAGHLFPVAF